MIVTFNVSPATASLGRVTLISTSPLNSVFEIVPSLFVSSVITTVGADVAVVSPPVSEKVAKVTSLLVLPPVLVSIPPTDLVVLNPSGLLSGFKFNDISSFELFGVVDESETTCSPAADASIALVKEPKSSIITPFGLSALVKFSSKRASKSFIISSLLKSGFKTVSFKSVIPSLS